MDLDRIPNKKLKVIINIWIEGREYYSPEPIPWNILEQGAGFTPSVKVLEPRKTEISVCESCPTQQLHGLLAHQVSLSMEFSRGYHSLLQGIFLTQGLNPCLLYCRQAFYHLRHQEAQSPIQDLKPYVHSPHLSLVSNSGSETLCNNLSEVACDCIQSILGWLE